MLSINIDDTLTSVLNSVCLLPSKKCVSLTESLVQKRKPAERANVGTFLCQDLSISIFPARSLNDTNNLMYHVIYGKRHWSDVNYF